MAVESSTAEGVASAIHALSEAAWKTGSSLSRLHAETENASSMLNTLADVKSLGNECDLIFAELEEEVGRRDTRSPPSDSDGRIWTCLATQVEEGCQLIQELQLLIQYIRNAENSSIGQTQNQRKLEKRKEQIVRIGTRVRRQTDKLRIILLLIKTYPGPTSDSIEKH